MKKKWKRKPSANLMKINNFCFSAIADQAVESLILEASTAIKPGLVDAFDSGAHNDMDLPLFISSARSFHEGFIAYLNLGYSHNDDVRTLQPLARQLGQRIEQHMFLVTKGVNTHKGAHFSYGFFLCALGVYLQEHLLHELTFETLPDLFSLVSRIAQGLSELDFTVLKDKQELSYGEKLYRDYGIRGVRYEVEQGFPTVQTVALPAFQEGLQRGYFGDQLTLHILFKLMENCEDTTLIHRGGLEGLHYVQQQARIFNHARMLDNPLYQKKLQQMNQDFIMRRLSPGGSADLLALTLFIIRLCENSQ